MQSRAIRRLAREMRSTYRKLKSWQKTAEQHNILNRKGNIDKSLAWQIAVDGFEPTEHDTLLRIGMPCTCPDCKRAKRDAHRTAHQPLFEMNDQTIIDAIQNRTPMPKPSTKLQKALNHFVSDCKRASKQRYARSS